MNRKELMLIMLGILLSSVRHLINGSGLLMGGANSLMGGVMNEPRPFNEPHPLTAITMATPTSPRARPSSSLLSSSLSSPLTIGIIQCIIL